MINSLLYSLLILLFPQFVYTDSNACIEPRNSYAGDNVADIKWTPNDTNFYFSTLGSVSRYEVALGNSPTLIHLVCEERFPIIEVGDLYYAVGSDFLPILSIYDLESNALVQEFDVHSENIRSIAFSDTGDYVAISKSNYDEDGFFDIDRNIEVRDLDNGELLATLISGEYHNSLYLPYHAQVTFVSADTVFIMGIDQEDAYILTQPIVFIWNWRTNEVNSLDIKANTLIELIDSSSLVILEPVENQKLSLKTMPLIPEINEQQPHFYDIEIHDLSMTRLSANENESLLAVENAEGHIWIVNLVTKEIILYREFDRYATVIEFDHKGQHLALGYPGGEIAIWDIHDDKINVIGNHDR